MKPSRKPATPGQSQTLSSSAAYRFFAVVALIVGGLLILNTVFGTHPPTPREGKMVHVTFTTVVESDVPTAFKFLSDWRYIQLWDPNVPKSKKVWAAREDGP